MGTLPMIGARCGFALVLLLAPAAIAMAQGDARQGAKAYRMCAACHSLEPGVHLTGPSLAGLWGKKAADSEDYPRYSKALQAAGIVWDENTLNAWLAHPDKLVPGNYMVFRGIEDDKARGDVIAFLQMAMAPGGTQSVVAKGLIPKDLAIGQRPEPLSDAGPSQQVAAIRHCRASYFVTTADGVETPYWEMNVRLKVDTESTGPKSGHPVIVGAGMMGDRVSIVFAHPSEIAAAIKSEC